MGNNNGKISFRKNKRRCQIHRVLGYTQHDPDVETLEVPFNVCREIFLWLPLPDLSRCMLVCKEWRSLIDTCAFWKEYMDLHFDFDLRDPYLESPVFEWKFRPSCLNLPMPAQPTATKSKFAVFLPFPDLWKCNIVVPYALLPPDGSLDVYHNFLHAIHWLSVLHRKLSKFGMTPQFEVCLLPWYRDRMPSAKEVLAILGAHREIMQTTQTAKELTKQELRSCYGMLCSQCGRTKFLEEFFLWFLDKMVSDKTTTVLFFCNQKVVNPTPCFMLCRLASNWIGGLLYSI